MTQPLRMSFEVACSAEHAFDVWTSGIGTWWPPDHTVSGDVASVVVLQSGVGGRIYERTPEGVELQWGEVTVWEPPARLTYRWHLGQDPDSATEVAITFRSRSSQTTRVEIEQRGWEQFGDAADDRRERNTYGWETVLPHFIAAIGASADQDGDH
jgi:uncharacterized protein YndB with AHSA1/START domain